MRTYFSIILSLLCLQLLAQNHHWVNAYGSSALEFGTGVEATDSGNIVACYRFTDSLDLDPTNGQDWHGSPSSSFGSAALQKLDSNGSVIWTRSYSATAGVIINDHCIDLDGFIYAAGGFGDSANFDTSSSSFIHLSEGPSDAFLMKISPGGSVVWIKTIGGTSSDQGFAVATDDSGNVFFAGTGANGFDLDPGPGVDWVNTVAGGEMFIVKLNASGDYHWGRLFNSALGQGGGSDIIQDLVVGPYGSIMAVGEFKGTVDFDPGPATYYRASDSVLYSADGFCVSLDSSGSFQWLQQFGGSSDQKARAVTIDPLGNTYVCGWFFDSLLVDSSGSEFNLDTIGEEDLFYAKLDTAGDLQWAVSIGGTSRERTYDIEYRDGSIFSTGEFSDTVDFDPGIGIHIEIGSPSLNSEHFLLELDTAGVFVWEESIFGGGSNHGRGLAVSENKSLYSTGILGPDADFDPGTSQAIPPHVGGPDIFLHRMTFCSSTEYVTSVVYCPEYSAIDGNTYYSDTIVSDSFLTADGCDSIVYENIVFTTYPIDTFPLTECDVVQSPSGLQTWTESGLYVDTLQSSQGCDSVAFFEVTILSSSLDSVSIVACDSFIAPSGTETWFTSGIYVDSLTTSSGCDSVIYVELDVNASFSQSIDTSVCELFTSPSGALWDQSGTFHDTVNATNGCDSIFIIHLSVYEVDTTVYRLTDTLVSSQETGTYQWLRCYQSGFGIIEGATDSLFFPAENGHYALAVQNGPCSDTSDCRWIIRGGINGVSEGPLEVYPNPSKGTFTLNTSEQADLRSITIHNTLGQEVQFTVDPMNEGGRLTILDDAGTYFISLNTSEGTRQARVIVIE